ncbi:MAG: GDP-mannose 4,6-dehydratase [Verrucomicrobiota bacterium]
MTALIFGANGQDGHYLAAALRARGLEVVGVSRAGPWRHGNVADRREVEELLQSVKPDQIFHLAANSTTRHEALFENHETISTGTLNILETARRLCPAARIFIAGSAVQFRNVGEPIDESTPFEASSAYSVARIQSVYAARYFRSLGLRCYVGYLFHHDSPMRGPGHVAQLVAQAAQRAARGEAPSLELADVRVDKEWTFAGDSVEAMLTLLGQDEVFEVVIGSGETHSIADWLEQCFRSVGLDWRKHVRVSGAAQPDYRRLVSNPARLRALGWVPRVGFEELARLMVPPRS